MSVRAICEASAAAAPAVAALPGRVKDAALHAMADALLASEADLVAANGVDVANARAEGTSSTLVDRLTLTSSRLESMAEGLRSVAAQPDPVGEIVAGWTRPNGLLIEQVRVPLGVVAVIYEARPNVTADVSGLCLKSGNACVLRGSSIALRSNQAIVDVLRAAVSSAGVPQDAIQLVPDTTREGATELMQAKGLVDLLVPRGGRALIESIEQNATVPYIVDGDGNCHVYVDRAADSSMAREIVLNAKTQRPSVCNAAETLLVHAELAKEWLPETLNALRERGVDVRGDDEVRALWPDAAEATEDDWGTEYLDYKIAVRVVGSLDEAIAHVNRWGTSNAEAIVTEDLAAARRFTAEVDS
ncbi:MAG TPA: glutamate-5-semialdehyde dehydrogenase, partial [Actinomycetota bacterium]|nr:glutamate-5-semialdehyde dehydrogenase [Actinomycetota bacterium]